MNLCDYTDNDFRMEVVDKTTVNRERFDYTKWQREYFDRMAPDEFMEKAVQYEREHPFQGKKAKILSAET